jgi:alpha-beta hydrolase superfamily lysophospholipase
VLNICSRGFLFWLSLFELIAERREWWGLSWLGPKFSRRLLLPLPAATLLGPSASWARRITILALMFLPALLLQIAASSLRNQHLNPLLRLRPGHYNAYTIDRLHIPISQGGYLPALHVVPHSSALAAVCIIHGSGCDKTSYAWRMVDTLIGRGMAVLLIDLDGHGENPRIQSFPEITEDAVAAVAWMRERYARVGLLGISLGGCVAARAVADGVAVDALVVLEAPPLLHYTKADVYREALALARPYLLDIFNDCTVQALVRAWEYPPIRAAISTWDLIAALDVPASLPKISAPLLLLYGGSDAIVKPRQAAEVWAALPVGATFHLVPGASHLTLILTPTALCAIGEWLEAKLKIAMIDTRA